MNKRTYRKVLKRIHGYSITNPPYALTSVERRVKRSFDDMCYPIVRDIMYFLDCEDEYYKMKHIGELI